MVKIIGKTADAFLLEASFSDIIAMAGFRNSWSDPPREWRTGDIPIGTEINVTEALTAYRRLEEADENRKQTVAVLQGLAGLIEQMAPLRVSEPIPEPTAPEPPPTH